MRKIRKILVIHTYGIGDIIMAIPMFKALHTAYPEAEIDLFSTNFGATQIIKHSNYLSNIYTSSFKLTELLKIAWMLRKKKYSASFVTSISFKSQTLKHSLFSYLVGANERIGEYLDLRPPFYTKAIKFSQSTHRVIANLNLVSLITHKDYTKEKIFPEITIPDNITKEVTDWLSKHSLLDKPKIFVHVGSSKLGQHRRWKDTYFVELIRLLIKDGLCVIILAGKDELELSQKICHESGAILVTNFDLLHIAAFINLGLVFLNSDSGLGHIASVCDTETISLFGPGDERKTAPYGKSITVLRADNIECMRCLYPTSTCTQKCMNELKPERVYAAIKQKIKF